MNSERALHYIYRATVVFLQLFVGTLTSCIPYRCSTQHFVAYHNETPPSEEELLLAEHWLYHFVPRHRQLIRWFDIPHWLSWALLGNDDDGLFGEGACAEYGSDLSPNRRAMSWACRNPFHNLFFYVLGSADCRNSQITLFSFASDRFAFLYYQPRADTVFASEHTSIYCALHGWKPFISMRLCYSSSRFFEGYLGWRERGNLGAKLRPFASRKNEAEKPLLPNG